MLDVSIRLLLTERCNFRCTYCHNESQSGTEEFLKASPEIILDCLRIAQRWGNVELKLSGGEPTLHPRLLDYVWAGREGGASRIVVITNGSAPDVLASVPASVDVTFNFPSADPVRFGRITGGEFGVVEGSIRSSVARGAKVALNCYAATLGSVRELGDLVEFAESVGASLKLLLPCEIPLRGHRRVVANDRLVASLLRLGFEPSHAFRNTKVFVRNALGVSLNQPWCPIYCGAYRDYERTIRISANGGIHGCIDADRNYTGSIYGSSREREERLDAAIRRYGDACASANISVPIIARPQE